ncbi:MAG: pyruvate kinase [Prochlorococcaceae cyanobacterium]
MDIFRELCALREAMEGIELEQAQALAAVSRRYSNSARNLLHFIALSRIDHSELMQALRERGLCSLAGCDAHLMASVTAVVHALRLLEGLPQDPPSSLAEEGPNMQQGLEMIQTHCNLLFGPHHGPEAVTIMVTIPAEAAHHPSLIQDLVEAGMTIARINCAHDTPEIWQALVEKVRAAERRTGRACRIAIDLAGPKLRTGALPTLPGVIRARPRRDRLGRLLEPTRILLLADEPLHGKEPEDTVVVPVCGTQWQQLVEGDQLHGCDASGRRRRLSVIAAHPQGLLVSSSQLCHFVAGLVFEQPGGTARVVVSDLPPCPGELRLHRGDRLRLTASASTGPLAIRCTLPQVFADVRPGERVLFDDGRISGVVLEVCAEDLLVEITVARSRGSRLRAEKGINFPDTHLHTPALTAKDMADLSFATAHADMLSYSFVHSENDIEALHTALVSSGREDLAVILKIETRQAFINLPSLLLAAMRYPVPLGVMIARGDLAIECGWEPLAEIQEVILRICEASHVPCIWATQILEEMARHGTPTRAEITDAAMGARAEAMMLNKGPNITETVRTLHTIMRHKQSTRHGVLRPSALLKACLSLRSTC